MKKNTIKVNKTQLETIIAESVKRILKEGAMPEAGHLYWKDEDGTAHTNSRELYRGVNGAIFVSHGDSADPEILYKDHSISYWDAEDTLWSGYKEYCQENNEEPTDDGFEKYVAENEDVEGMLDDLVCAQDGCNESKTNVVRVNKKQLESIIAESVKRILKENSRREVFTIDVLDVTNDEGIDDMQYAGRDYYSEDEAINAARECAKNYTGHAGVITVTVYGGEYEDENGNITGEPFDIYTISAKNQEETIIARRNAGYTREVVDEYIG